ncbi:Basic-leucine zipper domain-containing protein [Strongyloides ratti]|uniref:Basic-leucine zipper domain-containing protein n=1 Tax=Strongyloides ratti TaxID=34506 RepID=A0A090LJW6_STRRB|nr:Basic-leucine zipper domain-containing protein [Strongyloides ratti]CEF68428.1 Basic-leucine zipper domain-containing protein [Strongyloides ratti]
MLQAAYSSNNVYPMSSSLNFYNPFDSTTNQMNTYLQTPYQENIPPVMGNSLVPQTSFTNVFQDTTNFMFNDKNLPNAEEQKKYRERRDRNNKAAKQSRCKRRERERNLQLRVEELEKENYTLKEKIKQLENEHYSIKNYNNINLIKDDIKNDYYDKTFGNNTGNYYNQQLSTSYSSNETVSSSSPDSLLNKSMDGLNKIEPITDVYLMNGL